MAADQAGRPRMFGRTPSRPPLAWDWAEGRLADARHYWVVTASPEARPHARPVWGVWDRGAFLFSTASRAVRNIASNPEATVHLEPGDEVVIVEGHARVVDAAPALERFVVAYNRKYGWDLRLEGPTVVDGAGNAGQVLAVWPRVVYGWREDLETATRWRFDQET